MGTNRRQATEAEARALASTIRLRILRLCLDHALTNKEIAERLDANPATTLHHVRKLVATGFLVAEETRRGARGAREVPYRATGKSWTMNVRESGVTGGGQAMIDAFLDEIRNVDLDTLPMARLGLRLTEEAHKEFNDRVHAILDEFAQRPSDPEGHAYSVFFAVHPDLSREFGKDPDPAAGRAEPEAARPATARSATAQPATTQPQAAEPEAA